MSNHPKLKKPLFKQKHKRQLKKKRFLPKFTAQRSILLNHIFTDALSILILPRDQHQQTRMPLNLLSIIPTYNNNSGDKNNPAETLTRIYPISVMAGLETQQLNQLKDIFSRFDMDSDGSLTHLELAALLRSLGLKPTGDQIHGLLANMDANGNGSVEFEEFVNVIMPDVNEEILINQEQLLEVFRSFDRDGNGYITAAELAGSMAKMGQPLTYRELTEMMREADMDGDGVISFSEFASIMAKSAADFLGIPAS